MTLGQDVPGRGNIRKQQSSVRLYEVCGSLIHLFISFAVCVVIIEFLCQIGPRLTLTLIKVEVGLCSGEVLHHELGKSCDELSCDSDTPLFCVLTFCSSSDKGASSSIEKKDN